MSTNGNPFNVLSNKAHAERAHALLSASGSYRWLNCPGSVALIEIMPEQASSEAAERGTAGHELGELAIKEGREPHYYVSREEYKGKFNGRDADGELADAVKVYVDYVNDLELETLGERLLEYRFSLEWVYPGMFGTNDAIIAAEFSNVCHVIDYKNGIILVEPEENSQLVYYALGASKKYPKINNFQLTIVQPNAEHESGPIRSWFIDRRGLMEWAKKFKAGAIKTTQKDAPLVTGEWCKWCSARGNCPKLFERSKELVKHDFSVVATPTMPEIETLTDLQIAKILENKKLIENFFDGVAEYATTRLHKGEPIPGVKLIAKRRRKAWVDPLETGTSLACVFGEEAVFTKKLLTPVQAIKAFGPEAVAGHWSTIDTGTKAVPVADKGKAIEVGHAATDFDVIETTAKNLTKKEDYNDFF